MFYCKSVYSEVSIYILQITAYNSKEANYDRMMFGAGMINASLWIFYGLLLEDIYVLVSRTQNGWFFSD